VLLTLGRLPVALDLARGFKRAGWRVIVAETRRLQLCAMSRAVDRVLPVPPPVAGRSAYLNALRSLIAEQQIDLVVPVSEEAITVAALAGSGDVAVFSSPADKVLGLHDKLAFNRLAADYGMPVPRSWPSVEEAPAELAGSRLVVKPRHSASGRGFCLVEGADAIEPDPSLLVQEFLPGDELSSFAVAVDGRVLACVVYRSLVNAGSVSVCFERLTDQPGIEKWTTDFVRRSGYTGFIGFDFIVDAEGLPAAIEANPRATSGLHFLRTEDLPALLSGPVDAGAPLRYREERRLVESYSCFTALLGALGNRDRRGRTWQALRRSKDICRDPGDPMPFLLMTANSWPIIWSSIRAGCSFAEAAVRDIEWRDDAG